MDDEEYFLEAALFPWLDDPNYEETCDDPSYFEPDEWEDEDDED